MEINIRIDEHVINFIFNKCGDKKMIYILLILLLELFYVSYINARKDIFSPSAMLCIGYILSIICTIILDENIHFNTFIYIIIGIVSFCLGEWLVTVKSSKQIKNKNNVLLYVINVKRWKVILVVIIDLIIVLLYYKEISKLAGSIGSYSNFSEMMSQFRMKAYWSSDVDSNINQIVNQISKFVLASGFVFLYVFFNNVIVEKKFKKNIIYLAPVVCYSIQTIFSGGRFGLLKLVCASLVISYIIYHRKVGWNKNISVKYIKNGILIIAFVCIGFYMLKEVVGRESTTTSIIDYFAWYDGGSIVVLDVYFQSFSIKSFGTETFSTVYSFLNKLGLTTFNIVRNLDFSMSSQGKVGNVFTAIRRFHHDFGILGIIILQMLEGMILGKLYNRIKRKRNNVKKDLLIVIYSYLFIAIPMNSVDDYFYMYFTLTFIIYLLFFKLCYLFCVQKANVSYISFQKQEHVGYYKNKNEILEDY